MSYDPFLESIERKRAEVLERIHSCRISVLIWGPSITAGSVMAGVRAELRSALESDGHLVHYSEELYDPALPHSLLAQQVADVEAHDITLSLPDSAGSIAEIHDFARIPAVSAKIVAFLNEEHSGGYANSTLLQMESVATSRVHLYKACDLPLCIVEKSRIMIRRLQELYYVLGRRF